VTTSAGAFSPASNPTANGYTFGGLAVTTDHYLTVGLLNRPGLLLFDLYSGAPPLEYRWPPDVPFAPFDIAAAPGGGVWILDRIHRQYWGLDPFFRVLSPQTPPGQPARPEDFQPAGQSAVFRTPCDSVEHVSGSNAMPIAALSAIGIEALPDGSVLILDSPPSLGYSQLYRYRLLDLLGPPVPLNQLDLAEPSTYPLLGQDLAFFGGTLYVADSHGIQTFAFNYDSTTTAWATEPQTQFFPMLRFGGKALVTGPTGVSYDYDQLWAVLAPQPRARFETLGTLILPQRDPTQPGDPTQQAFDGQLPGCVWHRLLMDGAIPPGTQLLVESRAVDSRDLFAGAEWNAEPQPYLRLTGPEIPYYKLARHCQCPGFGTWELLFQAARGRYLQIRLTFSGPGNNTPRVQAVRAYYPRFSYLKQYLPIVYQNNPTSADFLDRYLANPEGTFTVLEGRILQVQELFDSRTVPAEYLAWLASWLGISFDLTWTEQTRRFFLANAPRFFQTRGTPDGVIRMLRLALDQCANASLFDSADAEHFSVRIVEHYLLRNAPGVVFGDPSETRAAGAITTGVPWTPAQGSASLNQQFIAFLSATYGTIGALNQAWLTNFSGFNDAHLLFPAIQPASQTQAADWAQFVTNQLSFTYAIVTAADLPTYQDFLTRRYSQPSDLNQAYGLTGAASLASFSDIQAKLWNAQLVKALPESGPFLQDWILFVSVVLPTDQNAYRFSVIVPVRLTDSLATQTQRQQVAQRVTQQEKPAHTDFDVKLYWAAFTVGQSRVGIETVAGPSSRFAALALDQTTAGASYLGYIAPWTVRGRVVAGQNQLKQPARIRCGGPGK
jgi:phage tail-like protein